MRGAPLCLSPNVDYNSFVFIVLDLAPLLDPVQRPLNAAPAMAKPDHIQFPGEEPIPILYEDRSVLALDKPPGWMLVPLSWQKTNRNLQAAIEASLAAGHFWARSRNLKFLRYIHRLDAETSGVLLFGKSIGAVNSIGELFETRKMEKVYLAVTDRAPKEKQWTCRLSLARDPDQIGRILVSPEGKVADTEFRLLASERGRHLIEARPHTGRQHQIRVHLRESGCPILGDTLYGQEDDQPMALRAVGLAYRDPFTRKDVFIRAPVKAFLAAQGFDGFDYRVRFESVGWPAARRASSAPIPPATRAPRRA